MRLTTRLLLPLLATVAVVMLLFALWALRQREASMTAHAQRVTNAYAIALGLALEAGFRAGSDDEVQQAIDRISREPAIFGVIVYGPDTGVLFTSQPVGDIEMAPLGAVRRVIGTLQPTGFTREIRGERVYSIVRPLLGANRELIGIMEVVQPWEAVYAEKQRTRQRFVLNTLALFAALTLMITLLVRRLIARPLNRFMAAVQALGRGELGYRTAEERTGAELVALSREFNRMAGQLEHARQGLVREAEERVLLARRLRETEKLAVVGNLAAGLGHEIAAPLHVIRGRAEMLRRKATDLPTQRNLHIITEQIDRITLIVRDLLDFARRREPRLEVVDAGALLRGVAEFLEPELRRAGVELRWEGDAAAAIHADPDLLHQVFINLVMNAIQVMAGRDGVRRITVAVTAAPDSAGRVAIDVEDTGPGFDDAVLERIFEPFFTTKDPGEGTGLGLAVARSIVEEHGGTIEADNRAGGGARFRIRLPAAQGEPATDGGGAAGGGAAGAASDGTPSEGTPSGGTASDGTASDGTASDGTAADGTAPDGAVSERAASEGTASETAPATADV
jgi:signal transduction histidine kinase